MAAALGRTKTHTDRSSRNRIALKLWQTLWGITRDSDKPHPSSLTSPGPSEALVSGACALAIIAPTFLMPVMGLICFLKQQQRQQQQQQ